MRVYVCVCVAGVLITSMETKTIHVTNKDNIPEPALIGTVPGQRGNPKLVLNGFTYIPNKRIKDKTYWNCSHVRQKKCRARLITVREMDNIFITMPDHNHPEEIGESTLMP